MKKTIEPTTCPIVGTGYRADLASWLNSAPSSVDCIEVTAEYFYNQNGGQLLERLKEKFVLFIRSLGLSLGTPGLMDRMQLEHFVRVVSKSGPQWLIFDIGFSRTSEVELGHSLPLKPSQETICVFADHVREIQELCGKPIVLRNIASYLSIKGTLSETEFINRLCEATGSNLLLDVTSLLINSQNHRFDPRSWLGDIDPHRIVQVNMTETLLFDSRGCDEPRNTIRKKIWNLMEEVLQYAPVQSVVIDTFGYFPAVEELEAELLKLKKTALHSRI